MLNVPNEQKIVTTQIVPIIEIQGAMQTYVKEIALEVFVSKDTIILKIKTLSTDEEIYFKIVSLVLEALLNV